MPHNDPLMSARAASTESSDQSPSH